MQKKKKKPQLPYDPEALVVKMIYDMTIKGHALNAIAEYLNNQNIESPLVLLWHFKTNMIKIVQEQ